MSIQSPFWETAASYSKAERKREFKDNIHKSMFPERTCVVSRYMPNLKPASEVEAPRQAKGDLS